MLFLELITWKFFFTCIVLFLVYVKDSPKIVCFISSMLN
jgi:hypothetical protein